MADMDTSGGGGGKHDGGKVRGKKMSTKIDMTPMVDLGFLLLTFFIFTTTFSKPNTMDLNMPNKDEDKKEEVKNDIKESNTISIIMGKDDKVYWHQKSATTLTPELLKETDYSKEGIRSAIVFARQNAIDTSKFTVVIKPTEDCNYRNVVDILDEMEITKSQRKAIVDITPEELAIYKQKAGLK
jgi:biopolymer transport protein ExbD